MKEFSIEELTIEEKAKRYDEALERAGERYNKEYTSTLERSTLAYVFPVLKESEDDRIKKSIINLVKWVQEQQCHTDHSDDGVKWSAMIAWLEKQGEQKHIIVPKFRVGDTIIPKSNLGLENISFTITKVEDDTYFDGDNSILVCNQDDFELVEQKPEWSEEDEKIRKWLIAMVNEYRKLNPTNAEHNGDCSEAIAWLEKQDEQKFPIEKLPFEMKTIGESLGFTTHEDCDKYNQMVSDLIMSNEDKGEQKSNIIWNDTRVKQAPSDKDILGWYRKSDGNLEGFPKIVYFCCDKEAEKETNLAYWIDLPNEEFDKTYWFEKQGKQKPINETDDEIADVIGGMSTLELVNGIAHCTNKKGVIPPKEESGVLGIMIDKQNPVEWSEDDEKMLDNAIGAIGAADYYTYDDKQEIENCLKSIRPQKLIKEQLPHWKKCTLPNVPWGLNSDYLTCPDGYYIELKELLKLPKDE